MEWVSCVSLDAGLQGVTGVGGCSHPGFEVHDANLAYCTPTSISMGDEPVDAWLGAVRGGLGLMMGSTQSLRGCKPRWRYWVKGGGGEGALLDPGPQESWRLGFRESGNRLRPGRVRFEECISVSAPARCPEDGPPRCSAVSSPGVRHPDQSPRAAFIASSRLRGPEHWPPLPPGEAYFVAYQVRDMWSFGDISRTCVRFAKEGLPAAQNGTRQSWQRVPSSHWWTPLLVRSSGGCVENHRLAPLRRRHD